MKVLITGITGFLGPYLWDEFSKEHEVYGTSRTCSGENNYRCDLTLYPEVVKLMKEINPDIVIHAAAMTDVNACQDRPKEAWANNVTATTNIVLAMPEGKKLVYISSDAIYSGQGPHKVYGDTENPLNIYGMTKFVGELRAAKYPRHLIVRTTMVGPSNGKRPSSLVDFYIENFKSGKEFWIFTDCLFSPLYAGTLAKAIQKRIDRYGIINLGSINGISKSKFALLLADHLELPAMNAVPIQSAGVLGRVPRSLDTRLLCFDGDLDTAEKEIVKVCEAIND